MRLAPWTTIPLLLSALARNATAQQAPPGTPATPGHPRVVFPAPRVAVYASLAYERKPGAEVCPGEQALREEIAARMGHDPFTPNPEGISVGDIRVSVAKTPAGFVARYTWTGSSDAQKPVSSIDGRGHSRRDCFDVIAGIAADLAIPLSILEVDYGRRFAPRRSTPAPTCPAADTAPAPAQCKDSRFSVWPTEWPLPPLEKPKLEPPEPSERWPIAIRIGASAWAESVAAGWGSLGLSADVGVRYRWFSAGVEAHGDPPLGSAPGPSGSPISFAKVSGRPLLCAHWGWFAGCGVGDIGRIWFPSRNYMLPASTSYSAAGVRAALEFPVVSPRFFLRASVDVLAPIRLARFWSGERLIFEFAGPSVGLGLGAVFELGP